jgi:capsular polysaccharide biosynthesis protein
MARPKRSLTIVERARGLRRSVNNLKLKTNSEFATLTPVDDVATIPHAQLKSPGVMAKLVEALHIPEETMKARLAGRIAGLEPPPWHDGSNGALMAGVAVSRVKSAIHLPEYGAVITEKGDALQSSISEALYLTPSLAALPGVAMVNGEPMLSLPRGAPVLDRAAVFMAWGGRFNYGHFLIDCLTALAALEQAGLLDRWRPIAPPLNGWQREGLRLMLGEERAAQVREIPVPALYVDDLVFASPMDHFLHAPNRPLDQVRERMLAAIDEPGKGPAHLYINRLGDLKRPLVNEAALESALVARGFVSVAPEKLPISKQIALFRDADVILAPSGAALANVLFCKPGARIFEIQPINFAGIWARGLAHFVGAHWHSLFAPSPLYEREVHIEGSPRPGIEFRWRVSVEDVLAWLDQGLALNETALPEPAPPVRCG